MSVLCEPSGDSGSDSLVLSVLCWVWAESVLGDCGDEVGDGV